MRKPSLPMFLGAGTLAAALLAWGATSFLAAKPPLVVPPSSARLVDPEPHADRCVFWQPWQRLVAPGETRAYLERLKRRLNEPSTRSGDYQKVIARARGVTAGGSESVCVTGRVVEGGNYKLDAEDARSCGSVPAQFLESNLLIEVEKLDEGGYINEIDVAVGTEHIGAEAVLGFYKEQLALLQGGYRGWSRAFPAYFALNQAGFGPIEVLPPSADPSARLKMQWLSQAMLKWLPQWAEYLLRLGDLVSVRTAFRDDGTGAELLTTRLETVQSGFEVTMPPAAATWLAHPGRIPLSVAHDVMVRFRGLVITLRGMRFTGALVPDGATLDYQGRFVGVDTVEVSGSYRGLSKVGLGGMIHDLVKEAIAAELARLTVGNRGKGWTFHLTLAPGAGGGNVFTYRTVFQSPINFLNILREDKDNTGNPTLPDKKAMTELNRWSVKTVDALLEDLAATSCGQAG